MPSRRSQQTGGTAFLVRRNGCNGVFSARSRITPPPSPARFARLALPQGQRYPPLATGRPNPLHRKLLMSTPPRIDRRALFEQAQALCRKHGATLLFLTLFGSALYGTVSPGKPDADARGIFLPSPESLALNKAPKSLHFSTGDGSRRNVAGDVDLDLWSAQHWLLKLLPSGDTGALDVLFSPSPPDCTLYRDPALDAASLTPWWIKMAGRRTRRLHPAAAHGRICGSRFGPVGTGAARPSPGATQGGPGRHLPNGSRGGVARQTMKPPMNDEWAPFTRAPE